MKKLNRIRYIILFPLIIFLKILMLIVMPFVLFAGFLITDWENEVRVREYKGLLKDTYDFIFLTWKL